MSAASHLGTKSAGIRVAIRDAVMTVTIDRSPVNALDLACYERLERIFVEVADDASVRCLILTGAGDRAFCAGLDLKEFGGLSSAAQEARCTAAAHRSFLALAGCPLPTIAAVNGPAIGAGCVLAALCDIRIASMHSRFALPEVSVGRCGGGATLSGKLPEGVIRALVLSGMPMSAERAHAFGFVEALVAPEKLPTVAAEWARHIASHPIAAVRAAKRSLSVGSTPQLIEAFSLEASLNAELFEQQKLAQIRDRSKEILLGGARRL